MKKLLTPVKGWLAEWLADLEQGVQVAPCRGQSQGIEVVRFELLISPAATAPQQAQHMSVQAYAWVHISVHVTGECTAVNAIQ